MTNNPDTITMPHEVCPMCGVIGAVRQNGHYVSCGDCGTSMPLKTFRDGQSAGVKKGLVTRILDRQDDTEPPAPDIDYTA